MNGREDSMSDDINLFISNGTCYYSKGHTAARSMIPCGNDANGHVACCEFGDNCLESSVCYNSAYGVTYLAGCSDPDYEHPSCPNKFPHADAPWVGLSYCNGTSNWWVVCEQRKRPAALTQPDACYCPGDVHERDGHLSQSSVIPGTASLPVSLLGSVQFSVGYYPTRSTALETSATGPTAAGPTGEAGTTSRAATPPARQPPNLSHQTDISPGAKIGAIVGGAVGGLLVALLIMAFVCLRRRQHRQHVQMQEEALRADGLTHGEAKGGTAGEPARSAASSPDTHALPALTLSELDTKAARPWSLRSELGDGSSTRSPDNTAAAAAAGGGGGGHGSTGQPRPAPSELASRPIAELP